MPVKKCPAKVVFKSGDHHTDVDCKTPGQAMETIDKYLHSIIASHVRVPFDADMTEVKVCIVKTPIVSAGEHCLYIYVTVKEVPRASVV